VQFGVDKIHFYNSNKLFSKDLVYMKYNLRVQNNRVLMQLKK
jgi:hypothetical protein